MTAFEDPLARWNGRYAQSEGPLFGEQPNAWLAQHAARLAPSGRVLCPADGDGRNSVWLASRGHQVSAFDFSEVGVERARRHARAAGLDPAADNPVFQVADASNWSWMPEAFDAVAAIFIQFADPALRARMFEGMALTLRPAGLLVIEGYGPRQLRYRTGGPGVREHLYTLDLLTAAFPGWAILASRDLDTDLAEGQAHLGLSHLVSMVLRKPG